jgi:hypothetical protein
MQLTENSPLDRYHWAKKKVAEIKSAHLKTNRITLYDIGSRDNILKKYIADEEMDYKAFDLEPMDASAEQWDIEKPFPYRHPAPQVITMLEIVEHLKNPWLCMKNIFETIAPGGYLVLTTPNPTASNSRLYLLRNGALACFTKTDLELNHHVFIPWPHIIERLLTDSGFQVVEYSTIDGKTELFGKKLGVRSFPARFISRLIKKVIERADPTACGLSYGIVAKRVG